MIGDHLVERKGLKQVERKVLKQGIKVTHQVRSITWINQLSYFKWVSRMVLGERSLLPSVGACRLCVGEPSVVLGRLTWKWWSEEHLRCLVEAIKRVDQEKQATPKRELVMIFQVVFSNWCSHASKDEKKKQANHNKKVHLIISGIHFIWVKNGIQHGIYWSSPSL
jgi:hypothetical protein